MIQDGVWLALKDTMLRYKGIALTDDIREDVDHALNTLRRVPFDSGEWFIDGNEVDVFVAPEKRGKWATMRRLGAVLCPILEQYGVVVARVHEDNAVCLRLAKGIGFEEVERDGQVVRLEMRKWKL